MGTKTTTEKTMPAFQEKFLTNTVLPYATEISGRDFVGYEGDRVSGLTPLQQQAVSGYGSLDAGAQAYGQASDIYGNLGGFQSQNLSAGQIADADIGRYMSPYTQNVIDASLRTLGGAQEQSMNQQGAQAAAAGAFGGSRHGVAEAETRKAYGQQASDLITNQMQQAFMNAQGMAQRDVAAQNQFAMENRAAAERAAAIRAGAAAGLTSTEAGRLSSEMSVLGAQMQAGDAQRALDQAGLDAEYAEFMREQQFPLLGLDALSVAAGGVPSGYGTTTQQMSGLGPVLAAGGSLGMGLSGFRGLGG